MYKSIMTQFVAFSVIFSNSFSFSETFFVGQKNREFTIDKLVINIGDTVNFINNDKYFHNVFSLSEEMMFDLGSFPKDTYKSVTFEQQGVIEVECAIHPGMRMVIEVQRSKQTTPKARLADINTK